MIDLFDDEMGTLVRSIYIEWGNGGRNEKTHRGLSTFVLEVAKVGQDGSWREAMVDVGREVDGGKG